MSYEFVRTLPAGEMALLSHLASRQGVGSGMPAVVVCHSEPGAWHLSEELPQRYATTLCPVPGAAYRVGRTMFETDRLPGGWVDRLMALDEVWVPTHWMRQVFMDGGVDGGRVHVVGEPVDTTFFSPHAATLAAASRYVKLRLGCDATDIGRLAHCPYRFISVGKWERRKNFETLLRAYLTSFPGSSAAAPTTSTGATHVELYILTSAYHSGRDFDAAVQRIVAGELSCAVTADREAEERRAASGKVPTSAWRVDADGAAEDEAANATQVDAPARPPQPCLNTSNLSELPRVRLLTDIPQGDLPSLYAAMDAFVSPTRGEGWGRPHAEAMAMGLPVLATNWSGLTEFLTPQVGYPIPVSHMAPVPTGAFAGHMQAEVDARVLGDAMRYVADPAHHAEAKALGAAARALMETAYSPAALAAQVEAHLRRIAANLQQRGLI